MLVRMMAEQEEAGEAAEVRRGGAVPVVQSAAQSVVVSYPLGALRRRKTSSGIRKS